jgi:hypothetical protein
MDIALDSTPSTTWQLKFESHQEFLEKYGTSPFSKYSSHQYTTACGYVKCELLRYDNLKLSWELPGGDYQSATYPVSTYETFNIFPWHGKFFARLNNAVTQVELEPGVDTKVPIKITAPLIPIEGDLMKHLNTWHVIVSENFGHVTIYDVEFRRVVFSMEVFLTFPSMNWDAVEVEDGNARVLFFDDFKFVAFTIVVQL